MRTVPITVELLKARGYFISSAWGLSEGWQHKDHPDWMFCNSLAQSEASYPIEWLRPGEVRFEGTTIHYMHELDQMEAE